MMGPTVLLLALVVTTENDTDDDALTKARALIQSQDYVEAIALLAPLVAKDASNAEAWLSYGLALQKTGELDRALEAHAKAISFEDTKLQGMYNTGATYALAGDADKALEWLERLHATGEFNVTGIGIDTDLKGVKDDSRFQKLFPTAEEFADPFVESTKVLHEWDGDSENEWFGWIARNIGDVDGDGVNDVTTSGPARNGFAGKVYVYSGKTGKLIWSVSGEAGDQLGMGIEAAGDTNADGIPDVVVGAPGAGKSYVYSGKDGSVLLTLEAARRTRTSAARFRM